MNFDAGKAESMVPDGHAALNRPLDGMFVIGGVEQDEGVAAELP